MKVLIVYATRGGVSRQAAEMLAAPLLAVNVEVSLFDIRDNPPSPEGFDVAVVGGSIRFGKLNSSLKKYIKTYKHTLGNMHSAAFICCGISENYEDYTVMQLPLDLNCSFGVHYFGGQLKPDRVSGFDKLIVKLVRESILTKDPDDSASNRAELPELMPDTINALAQRILLLR